MFFDGGYVYANLQQGAGNRFAIIDVSNPAAPTERGSDPLLSNEIFVIGERAYIASSNAVIPGLFILDIEDKDAPVRLSNTGTGVGLPWHIDVVGSYAYVGHWGGSVVIFDISDPENPTIEGMHPEGFDVQVVENRMYIVERGIEVGDGLRIVDVSDPSAPVDLGGVDLAHAQGLDVVEPYAYVAVEGYQQGGLHVIDVSDPTAPVEVGFTAVPAEATRVVVENGKAYVTEHDPMTGPGRLHVIDVSDAADPIPLGMYELPASAAKSVAPAYPVAYLGGWQDHLQVLNVECFPSLFRDGFGSGDTSRWSGVTGTCPPCNDAIGCREVDGKKIFVVPMDGSQNGANVCGANGYQCVGVPVLMPPEAACEEFHPDALVTSDLNGWKQAVWCDDDEGLACAGRTGCHHCPECVDTNLSCWTSGSTQLSELFVECICPG
jgi:hypothetical protein